MLCGQNRALLVFTWKMKAPALRMIVSNASLAFTVQEHLKVALNMHVWKDTTARKEAQWVTLRLVQLGTLAQQDLLSLNHALKERTRRLSKWEAALTVLKAFTVQMKPTLIQSSVLLALFAKRKSMKSNFARRELSTRTKAREVRQIVQLARADITA